MPESPSYIARVPSNIALIKYWGKEQDQVQVPTNDSISMTLKNCFTETVATPLESKRDQVFFDGQPVFATDAFGKKVYAHLDRLRKHLGATSGLKIETRNTFPDRCGLASSASGLGALTLAALAAWTGKDSLTGLASSGYAREDLAALARLGSGSACRSFFAGMAHWQVDRGNFDQTISQIASSETWNLFDSVMIVTDRPKQTSSTDGHLRAHTSTLFEIRRSGLDERVANLLEAVEARDLATLGRIAEVDALEMHAVMMTSNPALRYLTTGTSKVLQWIRKIRREQGIEVYFTLDAGPNVHVIGRLEDRDRFEALAKQEFPDMKIVTDEMGDGPELSALSANGDGNVH